MSITRQNLSVIIVCYKSDHVIHQCINSIDELIEVIVVDNSNNEEFRENFERKLKRRFNLSLLGPAKWYLGMKIKQTKDYITLDQEQYIKSKS